MELVLCSGDLNPPNGKCISLCLEGTLILYVESGTFLYALLLLSLPPLTIRTGLEPEDTTALNIVGCPVFSTCSKMTYWRG
jgi:hypothetical protein